MNNTKKFFPMIFFLGLITNYFLFFKPLNAQTSAKIDTLFQMKIDKTINPATLSHLKEVLKKARNTPRSGILIQINTPGGLVSVTKKMITEIGESSLPFIALVGPEGASATSAGAILSAASHQLFMAPGTNIGAATPIMMNGDVPKDSRDKAINDLVALVTSLRQARGKEVSQFDLMITKAKSYSAKEALELKIADGIISSPNELIKELNEKIFILNGKKFVFDTKNLQIQNVEMDLGQLVLNFLASPELAYILFLLGAALIYFELQAPGGFIAGGLGAICLLIAGISFQVIPLNMGGLGLILLAFILFVLEIYITSFGLLSLAGVSSLVAGSLFLFRTNDSYFELSKIVIFSVISAIVVFMGIVLTIFIKNRKQLLTNFNDVLPTSGTIVNILEQRQEQYNYQIKIQGQIWNASSVEKFEIGETVAIEKKDGDNMSYIVRSPSS